MPAEINQYLLLAACAVLLVVLAALTYRFWRWAKRINRIVIEEIPPPDRKK